MESIVKKFFNRQNITPISRVYANDKCPVCFDDILESNVCLLHPCSHVICKNCYQILPDDEDSPISKKCPICRGVSRYITRNSNNIRTQARVTNEESHILHSVLPEPIFLEESANLGKTFSIQHQIEHYGDMYIGNLLIESNSISTQSLSDYIFVLDISGSMYDTLDVLKEKLLSICSNFSTVHRVALITFSSEAKHQFALQPMTTNGLENFRNVVRNIMAGGSTNYKKAFELTFKLIEEDYEKTKDLLITRNIIFISDGQPDTPYTPGATALLEKYSLYTCTYGSFVCADTLVALLQEPENYRHFETADDLESLMHSLGANNSILSESILISSNCDIQKPRNIRKNDLINIPFVLSPSLLPNDVHIHISLDGNPNQKSELINTLDSKFVIGSYLYKKILIELHNLRTHAADISDMALDEKIAHYQLEIANENLVLFKEDLLAILNSIRSSIPRHNFTNYNRLTQNIDISLSVRSPRVSMALRQSRPTS